VNAGAVAYADEKAAKLVKGIEDSTRDSLNSSIREALEQGLSEDDLIEKLEQSYAFSPERAEVIARTEIARATVQGNVAGFKESGLVKGLVWNVTADDNLCPICEDNDGEEVELGESFPSGDEMPPAHPNCQCSVGPVLKPEEETTDTEGGEE
jgi:SPP1 gp7 family putative phage head morphogenesis protein